VWGPSTSSGVGFSSGGPPRVEAEGPLSLSGVRLPGVRRVSDRKGRGVVGYSTNFVERLYKGGIREGEKAVVGLIGEFVEFPMLYGSLA
jgi:hypothetical protein